MRRSLTAVICILLIAVCLFLTACGSDADENGKLVEVKDDSGKITGYERKSVNENGDITRLDVYDADQNYQYYELYEYDDNNRLYTVTKYTAEGFSDSRYVYSYDDDGNLTEKSFESPYGEATTYRYDKDGNETERLYYDKDEKLSKREVLEKGKWTTYDADGKIIK